MTVADIGTGTGILALWALEAGAKHVYGIEANQVRTPQALERIANAGYSESFTVHSALSYNVELPEQVDIIISEILGNLGDNEDMTPILADARRRFLKEDGVMLPLMVTTYLTPISSVKAHQQVKDLVCKGISERYNIDDLLCKLETNNQFNLYYDCILPKSTYLSEPQAVKEFNFDANDDSEYQTKIAYLVNKDGVLTGFKGHFVAKLSDNVTLDISGDDIDSRKTSDCWKHCFLPIESTVEVMHGDVIELDYQRFYNPDRSIPFRQFYSWKGAVKRNSVTVQNFNQSTSRLVG
jgi:protein arginine N-methyltransferase 1